MKVLLIDRQSNAFYFIKNLLMYIEDIWIYIMKKKWRSRPALYLLNKFYSVFKDINLIPKK